MHLQWLLEHPVLYDGVQAAAGARQVRDRLRPHMLPFAGHSVLDVGAGTGTYVSAIPRPSRYVAVDLDKHKLERLRSKWPNATTVVADASKLTFGTQSFDHAVCTFLIHHLTDEQVGELTAGLRHIIRRSVIFLDPLRVEGRLRSRALWSIDRGAHPRGERELIALIEQDFEIGQVERFDVHHRYLLSVATPRPGST